MTKMKKLLAVVLVCAIMAVCGASAFADSGTYSQSFYYISYNGLGGYMNVYTEGTPYPGVLIKTWPTNTDNDQIWDRYTENNDYHYFTLRARANNAYAINRHSGTGNTILWPIEGGFSDSLFHEGPGGMQYLFSYPSTGYLSTANGNKQGAQFFFSSNLNVAWTPAPKK